MMPKGFKMKIARGYARLQAQKVANRRAPIPEIDRVYRLSEARGLKIAETVPVVAIAAAVTISLAIALLPTFIQGLRIPPITIISIGYLVMVAALSPVILIMRADSKRTNRLELQMVDMLTKAGTTISAGAVHLPTAVIATADESEEPIRSELRLVYNEMFAVRRSFDKAIMGIAMRNDSPVVYRACALMASSYREVKEEYASVALTQAAEMIRTTKSLEADKDAAFTSPLLQLVMLVLFLLPLVIIIVVGLVHTLSPLMGFVKQAQRALPGAAPIEEAVTPEDIMPTLPVFLLIEGFVTVAAIGFLVKRNAFWTIKMLSAVFGMLLLVSLITG
jgi:Flp pilus assembly protein TadB